MKHYPHLAARVFNTPLLVHPAKLDAMLAGLGGRLLGADGAIHLSVNAAPSEGAELFTTARGAYADAGYRVVDGVAVVDVFGLLAHRGRMEADSSYVLGYQDVARRLDAALGDPEVVAVLLLMETPGGEVSGAFDLSDQIYARRGIKPIGAIAGDMAASAGYLIGSAADEMAVTQTGYAGSVGVVMRHVDMSQAIANEGYRVTQVYAGANKVLGNPYEPLPEAARASIQAEIEGIYELFVESVARNRGMDVAAVRATEASVYRGQAAVDAGLADRVTTADQMINDLRVRASASRSPRAAVRTTHSERNAQMSDPQQEGGTPSPRNPALTQTDIDRARLEGHAEGVKAGATQERERTAAILSLADAKSRPSLAQKCVALGVSLEQATALLAASPAEGASSSSAFAAAMSAAGNPKVEPDAGAAEPETETQLADNIVGLFRANR